MSRLDATDELPADPHLRVARLHYTEPGALTIEIYIRPERRSNVHWRSGDESEERYYCDLCIDFFCGNYVLGLASVSPVVLVKCDTKQRDTRQREFLSTTLAVAAELSTSFAPSDCREGLAGDIAHKSNILIFLDPHRRFCCYDNGLCKQII